jgi:hypothetical protein
VIANVACIVERLAIVTHEDLISHLDQDVVHTVDVEKFDSNLCHMVMDAALTWTILPLFGICLVEITDVVFVAFDVVKLSQPHTGKHCTGTFCHLVAR